MKQVVIRENRLLDLPDNLETFDRVAHYEADTEPGSSGAPVFSDLWEVVALHHSGVPKTDPQGRFLDVDGHIWKRGRSTPARLGGQRRHSRLASDGVHCKGPCLTP